MLDRDILHSGAYLRHFDHLPADHVWTPDRIEASLATFLAARPADADELWIFGYGSLIWNPVLAFDERVVATLTGWQRSFSLHLIAGRATETRPGRMLTLEAGGRTEGVAMRFAAADWRRELGAVWLREMVTGAYEPAWLPLALADGRTRQSIVFTVNRHSSHWQPKSAPREVAPIIRGASGPFGSNADYVYQLQAALAAEGLGDDYVDALAAELRAAAPAAEATAGL